MRPNPLGRRRPFSRSGWKLKNLLLSKPFKNPAIVAACGNRETMMFYWLDKQKEIFADDEAYVKSLLYETVRRHPS